ncbi:sulfite reductase subunit alpha [Niveispirillum fermenti]|uniref:sulfite reductase subunit alpha n=1 Tax=Niveispirillum fermenti TaxID=1233113 RepID=UPI003A8BA375
MDPVTQRWLWALAVLAAYALFCALVWRRHAARRRPKGQAGDGAVLVAYASQTGFARDLAERTVDGLLSAGQKAWMEAIDRIDPARLSGLSRALFIVSTTGEGDAPDHAAGFVRRMRDGLAADGTVALSGLEYGLLALGDRSYARFCAFGHAVDGWLRHQGARPLFDPVEVDDGDAGALRHWQQHLGRMAGHVHLPDWSTPDYAPWTLVDRRHLNPGSPGGPVHHLRLRPPAGVDAIWQAGDIAEIGPCNPPDAVAGALAARGGDRAETRGGVTRPLSHWLAEAVLPDGLEPLPHREYSIASLPGDGTLDLVVRQVTGPDGRPGLGSGWLGLHAPPGGPVRLRLRRNPGFHPPADDRPLILVGNGTGIAGLRAHLKARERAGHGRNWLLFGERTAAHDSLFADELAAWRDSGLLTRLDLAFSRDQVPRVHVQHLLAASMDQVAAWAGEGAAIYVCGSLEGMARDVHHTLLDILGADMLEQMAADRRYCRDVY